MSNTLLEKLRTMLPWKKSREYYAEQLGITTTEVGRLIERIKKGEKSTNIEPEMVNEEVSADGTRKVQFISNKPLSKAEIEELYGVDGINSTLSTYWNKQTASGKYLVSAFIKCYVQDFYTMEELGEKLKEIFPNIKSTVIKAVKDSSEEHLLIYIADDHCGNVIDNSIYNKMYSGGLYEKRLTALLEEILGLGKKFKSVKVVNLGDELDGWNGKTTRYDHDLSRSLSNKEQFDIYTKARKEFYDGLFNSGISNDFVIVTLNNSNHTGKGLSYIVNKALEFYLEGKYPSVRYFSFDKFIDTIYVGKHVIGLTHGKDDKLMKSPLPLNLDAKTDLWLFEYYDKLGISPSEFYISTVKGDIHKYNVNCGKSGRYVNVPSIAGGSAWIELNFGDSRAGALLEIINPKSPNITSIPIWFN